MACTNEHVTILVYMMEGPNRFHMIHLIVSTQKHSTYSCLLIYMISYYKVGPSM
jgi:hypothetical protein